MAGKYSYSGCPSCRPRLATHPAEGGARVMVVQMFQRLMSLLKCTADDTAQGLIQRDYNSSSSSTHMQLEHDKREKSLCSIEKTLSF